MLSTGAAGAGTIEAAVEALSERGEAFAISSSHGTEVLEDEHAKPEDALRIADQRVQERRRPVRERPEHERCDGTGYPDQLAGEAIPIGSRIIAVCDAFDAMLTAHPYRPRRGTSAALAELRRCAGTQFDPAVVRAFRAVMADELAPPRRPQLSAAVPA